MKNQAQHAYSYSNVMMGSPKVVCFVEQKKLTDKSEQISKGRMLRGNVLSRRVESSQQTGDKEGETGNKKHQILNIDYIGNVRRTETREPTQISDGGLKSETQTINVPDTQRNLLDSVKRKNSTIEAVQREIYVPMATDESVIQVDQILKHVQSHRPIKGSNSGQHHLSLQKKAH